MRVLLALAVGTACAFGAAAGAAPASSVTATVVLPKSTVAPAAPDALSNAREQYGAALQNALSRNVLSMFNAALGLSEESLIVHANVTVDQDIGGFEHLDSDLTSKLASLFSHAATLQTNYLEDLSRHVFEQPTAVPLELAHSYGLVSNCSRYGSHLNQSGQEVLPAVGSSDVVEAGSGFGFGFQVYCGCRLILTTGGGFGGGMTASPAAGVAGGMGGGGGLQMFVGGANDEGKTETPVLNVGGGGGGNFSGCAGSTDFGQVFPVSTMSQARTQYMAQQVAKCPAGALSLVGGGGGGTGFTLTHNSTNATKAVGKGADPVWIAAYGGGVDIKFMSTHAVANDAKCGGQLLTPTGADGGAPSNYTKINAATALCRQQCSAAAAKSLHAFWQCTCPCTQTQFKKLNLTFADKMQCM